MVFLKLKRELKKLSEKQQEFVATKYLEDSRKIRNWLEFLETVSKFDTMVNKALKQLMTIKIVLFVLAGIFLFIHPFGLILFLLLAFIFLFYRKSLKKKYDLHDSITYFLLKLVYAFKEETDDKNRLKMTINLKKPCDKEFYIRTEKPPVYGRVRSRTDKIYEKPLFEGTVSFLDGTIIKFDVILTHIHSNRTKVSVSGKLKYKTKYKNKYEFQVKMLVPKVAYFLKENTFLAGEDDTYYILKIEKKEKETQLTDVYEVPDPEALLEAIAYGYKSLTKRTA